MNHPRATEAYLFTQLPWKKTQQYLRDAVAAIERGEATAHRMWISEHPSSQIEEGASIGPGQLAIHCVTARNDLELTPTALGEIVVAVLDDLGFQGRWEARTGDVRVEGRRVATVSVKPPERSPVADVACVVIDTNSDPSGRDALPFDQTSLAELGLSVERQDEVRERFIAQYERRFASRVQLPQRAELRTAKPPWLRVAMPHAGGGERVREIVDAQRLHTVCESAHCPNMGECWRHGTATFLINGNVCTRSCRFCAVLTGRPAPLDPDEPRRLAQAARQMNLRYVVVTSVDRDDLPDGGAGAFAETVAALREAVPEARIEVLIPDFKGDPAALQTVFNAAPDVLNHNIETVPDLYRRVRPQARYERSLDVLARAHRAGRVVKSGIMLGLGETDQQVERTLADLRAHACDIVTIGQYLRPSVKHCAVARYVTPAEFSAWGERARAMGFATVESAPLVRSSYHAHLSYEASLKPSS